MNQLCIKPARRNAAKDTADTVNTYGNWVETWLRWSHWAPALDMMVVSEMGEQWSPATAPARQADMLMYMSGPAGSKVLTTMGIRMPKVAQEVPVEKASMAATTKMTAGRKFTSPEAECSM